MMLALKTDLRTQLKVHTPTATLYLTEAKKGNLEKRQHLQQTILIKLVVACRRIYLDLYLSHCTELNFKWTKDLNRRFDTPSLIRHKGENTLQIIGTDIKENIKLKKLLYSKEYHNSCEDEAYELIKFYPTCIRINSGYP